ncbi:MAG: hypothetical protein J6I38_01325 [Prevotella sp.]|nr:hypothetical protein [Prevotella sp.]
MIPLYNVEGKDIIIDCTHLDYISSAGLRISITTQRLKTRRPGKSFQNALFFV